MSKPRVLVVGAGVSGLAAAIRLGSRLGATTEITLAEARQEAGGRTRSWRDPRSGDTLDNGQHILMGCYRSTLEYLREIGSMHLVTIEANPRIPFYSTAGVTELRLGSNAGGQLGTLLTLLGTRHLTSYEKLRVLPIARRAMSVIKTDVSCETLFRQTHQPASLVRKLWEPIILATLNTAVASASATLFLRVLREIFLSGQAAMSILLPKVGLSELLVIPAIEKLEQYGVEIELGRKVLPGEHAGFDVVIDTSPQAAISVGFLPEFSPIVNLYLWLDRPVLKAPIAAFLGTTIHWGFSKAANNSGELIALTSSAATELADLLPEDAQARMIEELRSVLPGMRDATILRSQIIKEKRATFVQDVRFQNLRPAMLSGSGTILAGDAVQNGLPMTIEGAIRNGFAAADAAAADLTGAQ